MQFSENNPVTQKKESYSVLQPFIPPRLVEGKCWFIVYYVINPATGHLTRFRIKFNRIKLIKQRRELARKMMTDISRRLNAGWNPLISEEAKKSYTSLDKTLDEYMRFQGKVAEKDSLRSYRSFLGILKDWLIKNNLHDIAVHRFNCVNAGNLLETIRDRENISITTYNNYLKFYKALWNWMIEYNYAVANPFVKFKKIPRKNFEKRRTVITAEERGQLMRFLEVTNKNYLCICYLCYYCLLRPKEIALLKVKNLDLKRQLVFVPGIIAKNDRDSYRTIPDVALSAFMQLDIANRYSEDYLFSWDLKKKFVPGKQKMGCHEISRYWEQVIRPAFGWGLEKEFYSLKDSGITNMISKDKIAPDDVQRQADHTSLAITNIYIRRQATISEQIKHHAQPFDKD